MALHPLNLPPEVAGLEKVVELQQKLFEALCDAKLQPNAISSNWVKQAWPDQDGAWVEAFCELGTTAAKKPRQDSILHPLTELATAPLSLRQALRDDFIQQNQVKAIWEQGGAGFRELTSLPGMAAKLEKAIHRLCIRFYDRLSHDTNANWNGYDINGQSLHNSSYKEHFHTANPQTTVCPYCDGQNDDPALDHFYPKGAFPLLACSPHNLVPACDGCNKASKGKGVFKMHATKTADWLHPLFQPASEKASVTVAQTNAQTTVGLASTDEAEQARLSNHLKMIPNLATRWCRRVADELNKLKREHLPTAEIQKRLADTERNRGVQASALVHCGLYGELLKPCSHFRSHLASTLSLINM